MVTPIRDQTISRNNLIPNSLTQTEQWQEICYRFWSLLVSAGGVPERSSNGVNHTGNGPGDPDGNANGVANNLLSPSDFATGLAGVGWWGVIRFDNLGGGTIRFLFNSNDNTGPPGGAFQVIQHRGGPGTWSGGTITTLPTLAGFVYTVTSLNIHPFTDVRNLRWSTWRTPEVNGGQSIRFGLKEDGAVHFAMGIDIEGNTDAENSGAGLSRWALYSTSFTTPSSISSPWSDNQISATASWRATDPSGSSSVNPAAESALHRLSTNWTAGLDVDGEMPWETILLGQNVSAGRTLGLWIDAYAVPRNAPVGAWIDDTETVANNPTVRRKSFGAVTFFWPRDESIL